MIEATLRLRESRLGSDHPYTINSRNVLGEAYWRAGRLDLSIPLFELTLKQALVKFGPDHRITLRAQANLGVNYRDAGRPAEGARLMDEALRRARGRSGLMAALAGLSGDLAKAYEATGQFSRAEAQYREELAQARRSFGPDSPRLAEAMSRIRHEPAEATEMVGGRALLSRELSHS